MFETVASFLGRQLDERDEEVESNEKYVSSEASTGYGSLEGSYEYEWNYEHLSDSEYEDYRMSIGSSRNWHIAVCLMEKLRTFRQMKREDPHDEAVDDAVDTFKSCFRDAQCGGPKRRKTRVTNYMWIEQNIPLEESRWPDGWVSMSYGPFGVPDRVGYRG